jgi:hypothetical protein
LVVPCSCSMIVMVWIESCFSVLVIGRGSIFVKFSSSCFTQNKLKIQHLIDTADGHKLVLALFSIGTCQYDLCLVCLVLMWSGGYGGKFISWVSLFCGLNSASISFYTFMGIFELFWIHIGDREWCKVSWNEWQVGGMWRMWLFHVCMCLSTLYCAIHVSWDIVSVDINYYMMNDVCNALFLSLRWF